MAKDGAIHDALRSKELCRSYRLSGEEGPDGMQRKKGICSPDLLKKEELLSVPYKSMVWFASGLLKAFGPTYIGNGATACGIS